MLPTYDLPCYVVDNEYRLTVLSDGSLQRLHFDGTVILYAMMNDVMFAVFPLAASCSLTET